MTRLCSSSLTWRRNRPSRRGWTWLTFAHCSGISMPTAPGEGTRRAARRWLEHLHVADIPRLRSLFTHHPDYSDLTPVQYADGLAWLLRQGLITPDGRSLVRFSAHEQRDRAAAARVSQVRWTPDADTARRETGAAGERAVVRLLELSGSPHLVHVALLSDAYGYDIQAESKDGAVGHIEVKATTDPTRLRVHLTRHEYEVMCRDPDWLLTAVLVGAHGDALNVVTVRRDWLVLAAPEDRDHHGQWESARFSIPDHVLTPGIVTADGSRLVPGTLAPFKPVWGSSRPTSVLSM
ncbi:protein NO VEIN domain-containing protein [Streptomyces sp. NBC_01236]|uniref:protein NO VEIN domain-containing protein n=1 Tax=Streptomyces sp. NBC_01236 TaxID=2903789 RepID=UPI003FA3C126